MQGRAIFEAVVEAGKRTGKPVVAKEARPKMRLNLKLDIAVSIAGT